MDEVKPKTTDKKPHYMSCKACKHRWLALETPMSLNDFCDAIAAATCPQCGAGTKDLALTA